MIQQSRSAGYILTVTVEGVNDRYTWATQNVIKFICPVKILKNILPMRIANINISFFIVNIFFLYWYYTQTMLSKMNPSRSPLKIWSDVNEVKFQPSKLFLEINPQNIENLSIFEI